MRPDQGSNLQPWCMDQCSNQLSHLARAIRSCVFIYSANLCLLVTVFNLFTFKAIADKEGLLSFCCWFSICFIDFCPSFTTLLFLCSVDFFVIYWLNSFLISFCVCSIAVFFVVIMWISFNILKL